MTALGLVRLMCQSKLMGRAVSNTAEASDQRDSRCRPLEVRVAEPEDDGAGKCFTNGCVAVGAVSYPPVFAPTPIWRHWRTRMAGAWCVSIAISNGLRAW